MSPILPPQGGFINLDKPRTAKKIILIVIPILIIFLVVFLFLNSFALAEPNIEMVSGTEYISNEEGQIIVQLQDNAGSPILDANCSVSLLYPDKSFVFIDAPMLPTTVQGNYYYSFNTPATEGVYEEKIVCEVTRNEQTKEVTISDSFHVSSGLNLIVEVSRSQREQFDLMMEEFNISSQNFEEIKDFIDSNLYLELDKMSQKIEDMNLQIQNSQEIMEETINNELRTKFNSLYDKFKQSSLLTATIFDINDEE